MAGFSLSATREYYRRIVSRAWKQVKDEAPDMPTKSGLMLGLGETMDEVLEVASDLRGVGCDMLTLGQYLQPSPGQLPVERYVPPEEFDEIGDLCRTMGYSMVASGPFVRSSYHADEMAAEVSVGGFCGLLRASLITLRFLRLPRSRTKAR